MTVDQLGSLITDLEKRVTELEGAGAPVGKKAIEPADSKDLPKKDPKHDKY